MHLVTLLSSPPSDGLMGQQHLIWASYINLKIIVKFSLFPFFFAFFLSSHFFSFLFFLFLFIFSFYKIASNPNKNGHWQKLYINKMNKRFQWWEGGSHVEIIILGFHKGKEQRATTWRVILGFVKWKQATLQTCLIIKIGDSRSVQIGKWVCRVT